MTTTNPYEQIQDFPIAFETMQELGFTLVSSNIIDELRNIRASDNSELSQMARELLEKYFYDYQ